MAWGGTPLLMGILNVTPDSFYDGGRYADPSAAVDHALKLVEEGADILDIGAESTRPGAEPIDEAEEMRRLIPTVMDVAKVVKIPISVDTSKAQVARAAIDAGASIVNDVTALRGDALMADTIAQSGVGLVLMHMQGTPRTMQLSPSYSNVVAEVAEFFDERLRFASDHGIARTHIILDPGIGFGKLLENNLDLIAQLHTFTKFGCPVLVGISRKGFIGTLLGRSVDDRLWGTAGAVSSAVGRGAHIVRVHDVASMRDVVTVASAIHNRTISFGREQHA
ncbi:dihydropteroate synthase [Nitrospira sp. KM1]|uniref:dihydropteroate synthase n=1 Tax=Nitrospira sp. KM1 TaxID=1936990 RepID=UPI001E585023|nr:dihydropteroate synthase [Nitrospira sp. KM1]